MTKQSAIEKIQLVWVSDPPVLACCLFILELLAKGANSKTEYTVQHFKSPDSKNADPEVLLCAARYLSGADLPLLDLRFRYESNVADEFAVTSYEFSEEEVLDFNSTGKFEDPETGELVQNFNDHLYLFFAPSKLAIEMFSGDQGNE